MENAKLYPTVCKVRKHLEHRTVVAATPPTASWHRTLVLDHDVLEIGGRNPNTMLSAKNRFHDFLVVLAVGKNTE